MNLRYIRINQLQSYLESEAYMHTRVVPVTPQRVASQVRNPRAAPEDVALILAEEENGNVLAFIGLLPDLMYLPEPQKVYWISGWWIDPERGKSMGVALLLAAHQETNGCLLADATPETLPVFKRSRLFVVPQATEGIRLFLKPQVHDVLLRKKPRFKKGAFFLRLADQILSYGFAPFYFMNRQWFGQGNRLEAMALQTVPSPTPSPFNRGAEEIDWIRLYPWIVPVSAYKEKRPYPFSTTSHCFQTHALELKWNGHTCAWLYLTQRDDVFKLHYAYYSQEARYDVAKFLLAFLYRSGAKEFTTFDSGLTEELKHKNIPFCYKHATEYQYVWGKSLRLPETVTFQYGDGDAIFT